MRQIFYDIRGSFNCMFLICWLNCIKGGTGDSLRRFDDRFNFHDFPLICAPEPD